MRSLSETFLMATLVILPFIKIGGESAFRFDVQSLRLYLFGKTLWMEEFFILLTFVLFLTFAAVALTTLFGRIWCGWFCPQTVLTDITRFAHKVTKDKKASFIKRLKGYLFILMISAAISAVLIWYFVSPYEFIPEVFTFELSFGLWVTWLTFSILLFLQYTIVRNKFCENICPYAKLQEVLFDDKTLSVVFNKARTNDCIQCKSCLKVCPVGIDIRNGSNASCINCARCVDECTIIMGKKKKAPIINYVFGSYDSTKKIMRARVVSTAILAMCFLVLSIYLMSARTIIDFMIMPNYNFKPAVIKDMAVNSYTLKVKNMKDRPVKISFSVRGIEGIAFAKHYDVTLQIGETKAVPAYVTARYKSGEKDIFIFISAHMDNKKDVILEKKVAFLYP